uniref:Uncharacterized protein n=1 Tax=Cannabis sativa TaxID=3483 RepID=A0A803Q7J6_CANSA
MVVRFRDGGRRGYDKSGATTPSDSEAKSLWEVELVEDEIVEMGELFGRGGHVDPKVALDEPHRLESFSELSSGENIILVQI